MNKGLWVFYGLLMLGLLLNAHDHGKPRLNNNFWISLLGTIITLALLWWSVHWRIY